MGTAGYQMRPGRDWRAVEKAPGDRPAHLGFNGSLKKFDVSSGLVPFSPSEAGAGSNLPSMAADSKQEARQALRRARASYERDAEAAKEARRKALADAQAAGLSLREIADEVGLHYSRISEILNDK